MNHALFQWTSRAMLFVMLTFSISSSVLAIDLSDIDGHDYEDAITLLTEAGIISGYPDGTYQPEREVNRVEFLKIVMGSVFDDIDLDATDDTCGFSDTVSGEWYIPYLCRALEEGVVQGYADGTFKPEQTVNFVEASKIASLAHGQELSEDGSVWYEEYVTYISDHLFIPPDVETFDAHLVRGQVAELLGRYYLYDQDELDSYLEDHGFDYVIFNGDENTLDQKDNSDVLVSDYLNETTWLTYEKLLNNPLQESDDDWSFTAETGDNTGIFTNWNYTGSDGPVVDIATDAEGTTINIENTQDYSLGFTGFLEAIFQNEAYTQLTDDSDFSGTLNYLDDTMQYDWSENRANGESDFEDSLTWSDSDTGSSYERSILDGAPTESFLLTTPEADSDDEDQTSFSHDFQYDEDTGGVQNWLWQSSDSSVLVNQIMKDDYYTEFLGFAPSDQAQMILGYDHENVTESFDFSSEDGTYVLAMDMTNDDFDESVTYESDEMDINMVLSNMNTLDGTVTISDDSGETVAMTFTDSVLNEFSALVQDESGAVEVYYSDYGDYAYLSGILTTEEGSSYLFTEEGMMEHGASLTTDEISVSSGAVILASNLIDLTFNATDAELEVDWGHSGTDEIEEGSLLFQGLLSDFSWGLDLGDRDAYDEALQSGNSFKWYKGFDLGLHPSRLIQGQQAGGIKGNGVKKDWTLEFDPESAELDQDLDIEKEGFKKEFEANISLVDNWMRQQMELIGEFKGIDVNIDSNTTVENGEVNGTTNVHATTDNVDAEFNVDFGSGRDIEIDGSILISPLGHPWRVRTDFSSDGSNITVKPKFSIPLVDDENVEIDLDLGGDFDSNGRAQGNVNINIREKKHGIGIGLEGTVGEGGDFGGSITVGVDFSF